MTGTWLVKWVCVYMYKCETAYGVGVASSLLLLHHKIIDFVMTCNPIILYHTCHHTITLTTPQDKTIQNNTTTTLRRPLTYQNTRSRKCVVKLDL